MTLPSLHDILLGRLADIMRRMREEDARSLSACMTTRINAALSGEDRMAEVSLPAACKHHHSAILAALPAHMMNVSTLAIPWRAFAAAHQSAGNSDTELQGGCELLCSLPEVYASAMRSTLAATSIWPGSILDHLSSLLSGARREIVMISPYWSPAGIDAVLRRIRAGTLDGVQVVIMTLPRGHHKAEALQALLQLQDGMRLAGATCKFFSPRISSGWVPLLHAKAVVADVRRAYLGSANFSANGWDTSVEVGVAIHGQKAAQLRVWLMALCQHMERWDPQHNGPEDRRVAALTDTSFIQPSDNS